MMRIKNKIYRIAYIAKIFFLSPSVFIRKLFGKLLIKFAFAPKGDVPIEVGGHRIIVYPSRNDWWKAMYYGCCDVEIEHAIRRHLDRSGVFIDVGASVGYFSAVASGIVGVQGQVHSFEANPAHREALQRMARSNPASAMVINCCALGADDGVHRFHIKRFANHTEVTMVDGLFEAGNEDQVVEVPTRRLDSYLAEKAIETVSLIKIDVEGYEYPVLKGLERYFQKHAHRPPIIVEIMPSALACLGHSLDDFYDYMNGYGYQAHDILNLRRKVDIRSMCEMRDVVFVAE